MYIRKCPQCKEDMSYSIEYNMRKAEEKGSLCMRCANLGRIPWNKGLKNVQISNRKDKSFDEIYGKEKGDKIRNKLKESLKGRKLTEKHKQNISNSEKGRKITWGDKISKTRKGKKLDVEHIEKLKENHVGMTGRNHTPDTLEKMSNLKIGKNNPMFGKKLSDENKQKKRLKALENITTRCGQVMPNYNPKGCEFFNVLMIENNCNIIHAENGGEYYIKELGYFLDGYDIKNNIVYEFDEKQHFDSNGELKEKDKIRQKEIESHLKCNFIRIKEIS